MFKKIIITSLFFVLTLFFIGCGQEEELLIAKNSNIEKIENVEEIKENLENNKSHKKPLTLEENKEQEQIEEETIENKEETIGIIGDYAATLEVIDNFNTNCYVTKHLMKSFVDADGYLNGVNLEEKLIITNKTELNDYVDYLEKDFEEKNMKENLNIYDETFFNTNNLYIIVKTTSCPSYKLIQTEKLSTINENKFDYVLKYENDINMTINGFKTCFFVIEIEKTICDSINDIEIETIS